MHLLTKQSVFSLTSKLSFKKIPTSTLSSNNNNDIERRQIRIIFFSEEKIPAFVIHSRIKRHLIHIASRWPLSPGKKCTNGTPSRQEQQRSKRHKNNP